jgi:hypothetical protein
MLSAFLLDVSVAPCIPGPAKGDTGSTDAETEGPRAVIDDVTFRSDNTSRKELIFPSCTQLNLNRTVLSVCIKARAEILSQIREVLFSYISNNVGSVKHFVSRLVLSLQRSGLDSSSLPCSSTTTARL